MIYICNLHVSRVSLPTHKLHLENEIRRTCPLYCHMACTYFTHIVSGDTHTHLFCQRAWPVDRCRRGTGKARGMFVLQTDSRIRQTSCLGVACVELCCFALTCLQIDLQEDALSMTSLCLSLPSLAVLFTPLFHVLCF